MRKPNKTAKMARENKSTYIVPPEDACKRLDVFLSERDESAAATRSYVQKIIEDGHVLVNGAVRPKNYRLKAGDSVQVDMPAPIQPQAVPQDIPLDILYEDAWLVVLNKPKGMVVHPAPGNADGTLVNALLFHCGDTLSGINGTLRPGIVHRIDKDTSGLLVVAKNDEAHLSLAKQLEEHSIERRYVGVVHGRFKQEQGRIDRPIGRSEKDRKKYTVTDKNAKQAVTHYRLLDQYDGFSLAEFELETGRTHQIRVHMAAIGHPLAGDTVYGPKNTPKNLQGQCLHAAVLGFTHPKTGERMRFEAPLPPYFQTFISKLEGARHGDQDPGSAGGI